jgi:hypothetical protein
MARVTRLELVEHIESAFAGGSITRSDLIHAATASQARPEVLAVLRDLPDIECRRIQHLWEHLGEVPIG